ncbi:hypothetical protein BAUCODRAFT_144755 [Baudoinia panamericana UAMH 10762]|uniref:DUF7603 domain-containing protein n=1 Tax=Baudoinia panamericana (strain UAMH 10762) TaxID=717646 RepID=M2M278_BAUPA|nr:uncharacterized protein BAUCODRAFT_144755 [Baudoinia panamericana UAMH 10762]EMD01203.1 hypothetical protein BAUCODRAFT_144755 [Baudoinia panamericana UAMH 10762]
MAHSQRWPLAEDHRNFAFPNRTQLQDDFTHSSNGVRKQASLAQIHVPSFRSFTSSIPVPSPQGTKRQQVHLPARSPRAASFSIAETASPRLVAPPTPRPYSLHSPLPTFSGTPVEPSPPSIEQFPVRQQKRSSYTFRTAAHSRNASIDSRLAGNDPFPSSVVSRRSSIPVHERYAQEQTIRHAPGQSASSIDLSDYEFLQGQRDSMGKLPAPDMTLEFNGVQRTLSDDSLLSEGSLKDRRSKSSGGRRGIFGWKSSPKPSGTESPTTTFSDRSTSPLPSPATGKAITMDGIPPNSRLSPPTGLDINAANSPLTEYFDNPDTPILLGTPESNAHVRELEKELAEVSVELAQSIRREMDLEDELERIRADMPSAAPADMARRGSDYFSDSGASSVRYPVTDIDARLEQMEQKLRKAEQEKAQLKVDTAATLQAELSRRRDLEQMVHALELQLAKGFDDDERISQLEATLEETRRRLAQERQAKDTFGELYSATKLELEQHKGEKDNLRDEVVPQLRARIEGLEHEVADTQALMYENARLQQEMVALRGETPGSARFDKIREEGDLASPTAAPRSGLSRSNSLARNRTARGGSMSRSGTVTEGGRQRAGSFSGHPVSVEGVKEVEDQRDALHKALKLLLRRHEKQQKDHERAIRKLRTAKDQAEQISPKRTAYQREVSFLKEEVTTLRKRTEDALEQKWQYEKGLSGLKMDLDRAEQETRSLRDLLQEHDILAPARQSPSLAYDRDGDAEHESIKLSISTAESERDQARQVAAVYRQRAQSTDGSNSQELLSSAQRMDELADELESQVQANVELRDRLAEAVAKGEREQRESTRQIQDMQSRLAGMEESVLSAQQHSETLLGNHESEARRLDEATSPALQRLRISIPDAKRLSPTSPMFAKSPRLGSKKGSETSLLEAGRTQLLERKVKDLEGALREAEEDMQAVVERVNRSQLDVADLQTQRDAAVTQMRKLQRQIVEERERAEAWMGE